MLSGSRSSRCESRVSVLGCALPEPAIPSNARQRSSGPRNFAFTRAWHLVCIPQIKGKTAVYHAPLVFLAIRSFPAYLTIVKGGGILRLIKVGRGSFF